MADSYEVPMLDGCEDFHVYLCHSETTDDRELVTDIKFALEDKKFRCLDPEVFYDINSDELRKVEDGVMRCQKVLFILTKKFLEIEGNHLIYVTAKRKADERNDSGLMVLAIQDVDEGQIPTELRGFSSVQVGQSNYIEHMTRCLAISKVPEMAVIPADGVSKGLAWSYFYGYLTMLLPGIAERYRKFAVWREPPAERVMPLKMFILIPASCYCPPSLTEVDEKFKLHPEKIPFSATRAGCHNRNYNTTVYSIEDDQDNNKKYYAQIEFATPVLSMWEMSCGGLAGMREQDRSHQRTLFYDILRQILTHSTNERCHDKAVLLYYDEEKLKNQTLSSIVLDRIKLEITLDLQKELQQRRNLNTNAFAEAESAGNMEVDAATENKADEKVTFVESSVVYEEDHSRQILPRYQLACDTCKGKALIISINQFDHGSTLKNRRGSAKDEETVKQLWTDLKFHVEVVQNITGKGIITTARRVALEDHSKYSAFVCCILSHGDLGEIYGCDGQKVRITDITHMFTEELSKTLANKPKMFFIQACQGRSPEGTSDNVNCVDALDRLDILADASSRGNPAQGVVSSAPKQPPDQNAAMFRAKLVPGAKDFIMSYATLPGAVSYRHTVRGTFYIDSLVHCIRHYRNTPGMDLERILKKVSETVETEMNNLKQKELIPKVQFPFHLTTTNKLVYLRDSQF